MNGAELVFPEIHGVEIACRYSTTVPTGTSFHFLKIFACLAANVVALIVYPFVSRRLLASQIIW